MINILNEDMKKEGLKGIKPVVSEWDKAELKAQTDSTLSRKYEGTGLGLPLSKLLIEIHGGSLDLHL